MKTKNGPFDGIIGPSDIMFNLEDENMWDILHDCAYEIMFSWADKWQDKVSSYKKERSCLDKIIYFAQEQTGLIKIGITTNLFQRLNSLQMERNTILNLLFHTTGNKIIETELHTKFSHLREEGEWYRPDAELLEFIKNTKRKVTSMDVTYYNVI